MGVTFPGSFFYKGQKVFIGFTYPNAPRGDEGQPAGVIVSMCPLLLPPQSHGSMHPHTCTLFRLGLA